MLSGASCGPSSERVVESVATQVAGVFKVGELATQLTGVPRAVLPFMNWTVPVIGGPPLKLAATEAVKPMLPPVVIVVVLGTRVVAVLAPLTVMETADEVDAA